MKKITFNEDLRLANGSPVYHVFFEEESPMLVDRVKGRKAKGRCNVLQQSNPDLLREISGKTFDEARAILRNAGIEF